MGARRGGRALVRARRMGRFRNVHTIKGEARAFDLAELEQRTTELEEELDALRAAARGEGFVTTDTTIASLLRKLDKVRRCTSRTRRPSTERVRARERPRPPAQASLRGALHDVRR